MCVCVCVCVCACVCLFVSARGTETDSSEPLSALQFVSPWVFLACCPNGDLYAVDTRSPSLPPPTPVPVPPPSSATAPPTPTGPVRWGMHAAAGAGADVAGCRVARLSSGAEVVVSDLRNPGGPVRRALLDVPTDGPAGDHLKVSWAPALEDCLAVSGERVRGGPRKHQKPQEDDERFPAVAVIFITTAIAVAVEIRGERVLLAPLLSSAHTAANASVVMR